MEPIARPVAEDAAPIVDAPPNGLRATPLRANAGSLSDQVADKIEQDILLGELRVGESLLSENELCAMFGVSRSVVRAALSSLSARDLIDVRSGHRTRVSPPTDSTLSKTVLSRLARSDLSLHSVMRGRATIEQALIPLAATHSEQHQRDHVYECFSEFERAVNRGDWNAAIAHDLNFHRALLEAVNQESLSIMLRPLHLVMFVCARPVDSESVEAYDVAGHREIADALGAQDEARLREAIAQHFLYVDSLEYREYAAQPFRTAPNTRLVIQRQIDGVDDILEELGTRG